MTKSPNDKAQEMIAYDGLEDALTVAQSVLSGLEKSDPPVTEECLAHWRDVVALIRLESQSDEQPQPWKDDYTVWCEAAASAGLEFLRIGAVLHGLNWNAIAAACAGDLMAYEANA